MCLLRLLGKLQCDCQCQIGLALANSQMKHVEITTAAPLICCILQLCAHTVHIAAITSSKTSCIYNV